ncbi:MAG TPA: M50 family metallopeptidase [Actinomycetota bacterium]|nr:M50 family metallopeptidase [Actinomycetota bacterium]
MNHPPGDMSPGGAGVAVRPPPPVATPVPDRARPDRSPPEAPNRRPQRADGLQMLGRFEGSGHRDAPALVRRVDGQVVQLTPLLDAVLEAIDGRRDHGAIAKAVAASTGKVAGEEDIHFLIEQKLRPLGLLQEPDGSQPSARKANPLLGIRLRMVVSNERVTRGIAAPFSKLFVPPVVAVVTLAFLVLTAWLLVDHGLAPAVRQALYEPGLLLLVLALTTVSAGFHELGHAAACTYGGGKPGAMGMGLYLVWPAFYTDVTDAYRLDRRARLRVDLGGIYFNAIFALVAFGLWAATGWEALLAVIPLQVLQMLRQLIPLVRLDGYHILADLTGVPDLFAHIKPILLGMLPTRWGRAENKALKPRVRVVVVAWVLLVVPLLMVALGLTVVVAPRLIATAWDSAGVQWNEMTAAWANGERAGAAVEGLSILALAIPILSMGYLVTRIVRRVALKVWRSTSERPVMRALALAMAACLVAALAAVWWPDGQYRPIEADERGTIAETALNGIPARPVLLSDSAEVAGAVAPSPAPAPVKTPAPVVEAPPLEAVVLSSAISEAEPRYTFDLPAPPGEGDNQALAVNYTDGSAVIAMALSLIFSGDATVDNANEAYALASCRNCLAAAIAFQLVVILDEADVIVPENSAVAVGAYCVRCVTFALAFQVVVRMTEPLTAATEQELDRIWSKLEALEENVADLTLAEIHASLVAIENEILDLLAAEEAEALATASEEAEDGALPVASPTPTTGASPTTDPSPTPTTGSDQPTPNPSPSPTPTSEPSPTAEPSPSPSP